MPDNILKGTIQITAPGVQQTVASVETSVARMADSLGKVIPKVASVEGVFTKLSTNLNNLDFSKSFEEAQARINASIDKMASEALGIGAAVEQGTTPAIRSIRELEIAMQALEKKIFSSTNVQEIQNLSVQFGVLEKEAIKLKNVFEDFSTLKISPQVSFPANLIDRVKAFGGGVAALQNPLTRTEVSINKTTAALGKVASPSNSATLALVNLSRVAQDAPFGFLGIANNLNPLLESFQRLRAESGSTSVAMKALGSSLLGAGGIGLALGVVSSLLIVFGDRLFSSGSAAKTQADKLKEARESLQTYVESLEDVNRARVIGNQNAQEELVKLATLKAAIENVNIPIAKRKQLVDQLQEQYPKYFQNISDETILAGGATEAYNMLSSAIIASARARAASESIVDIQKQVLANDSQQLTITQEISDLNQKIVDLKRTGGKAVETSLTGEERLTATGAKLNVLQEKYNDLLKKSGDIFKENNSLNERAKRLTTEINTVVEANPDALLDPTGNLPKVKTDKKIKVEAPILIEPIGKIEFVAPDEIFKEAAEEIRRRAEGFGKDFRAVMEDNLKNIEIKPRVNIVPDTVTTDINAIINAINLEKLKENLSKAVSSSLKDAAVTGFAGIGEALGTALSGGNLQDSLRGIFSSIGSIIQQLGVQIIALSPLITALKASIKTLSPAGVLAAGIGLVALGSIIKGIFAKTPGFAKGGTVPPGYPNDTFLARLSSGERIIPANQQFNLQPAIASSGGSRIIMHKISGPDLLVWIAEANALGGRYR